MPGPPFSKGRRTHFLDGCEDRGPSFHGLSHHGRVHRLNPLLPAYDLASMENLVSDSLARQRVLMTLLNLFSAIALIIAVVGLYAVLSFLVASTTRELGI